MKRNLQFIVFFSICVAVTLLACYTISLSSFDWRWLKQDVLVSILSGVVASFMVMLLAEVKNYFVNKKGAEDAIFYNCAKMYALLTGHVKTLGMYLGDKREIVPSTLLEYHLPILNAHRDALSAIDYTTTTTTPLERRFVRFKQHDLEQLRRYSDDCKQLQIAILRTQRDYIEKHGTPAYNPTSKDALVNVAMQKLRAYAEAQRVAIDGLLQFLVCVYSKRYTWHPEAADNVVFSFEEQKEADRQFFEC